MDLMLFADQFRNIAPEDLEDAITEVYPTDHVHFSEDGTGCITLYDFGWHCTDAFRRLCMENGILLGKEIERQRKFDNMWLEAVREAWAS